jgi:hypothetical protein
MKTAAFDDLPVVGVLHQCVETATGWRGTDESGVTLDVRRHPSDERDGPPRIPPDNRITKVVDGRAVGVLVLKRKRRSSSRRPA